MYGMAKISVTTYLGNSCKQSFARASFIFLLCSLMTSANNCLVKKMKFPPGLAANFDVLNMVLQFHSDSDRPLVTHNEKKMRKGYSIWKTMDI